MERPSEKRGQPPGPRLMPGPPQIVQYIGELCRCLLNQPPREVEGQHRSAHGAAAASASPSGPNSLAASTSPRWPSSMGPRSATAAWAASMARCGPGWGRSGPTGNTGRRREGGLPAWRAVAGLEARARSPRLSSLRWESLGPRLGLCRWGLWLQQPHPVLRVPHPAGSCQRGHHGADPGS